jgi:serine/threonine protein kinase
MLYQERDALRVFQGVCQGVNALHEKGWAHRDIKPHNVLLMADGTPILMDLGSVTTARVQLNTRQDGLNLEDEAACKSSAPYRAPELFEPPKPPAFVDEQVDIWSLGCTLYCMAFWRSPFESPTEGVMKLGVLNGRVQYPDPCKKQGAYFSPPFCNLITGMLTVDPKKRLRLGAVMSRIAAMEASNKAVAVDYSFANFDDIGATGNAAAPDDEGGSFWDTEAAPAPALSPSATVDGSFANFDDAGATGNAAAPDDEGGSFWDTEAAPAPALSPSGSVDGSFANFDDAGGAPAPVPVDGGFANFHDAGEDAHNRLTREKYQNDSC